MADDRTLRVRLLAEVNSYVDGMRRAGAATADFGKQVTGQGTAVKADLEKVGRSALLLSGGLALALGASVKAAMDWESAFAGVAKTVDATVNTSLADLEEGLRGMARELPATHKELAAVAEAAGQLGVQTDAILGFTKVMVDLGETTNLTADEAATSIAQIANIMGTDLKTEVDNFGATLVELGNNGASTEREILDMAQRLAGAGKLIGASEGEVLALANAMASMGIQAQLGGGAMSRTLLKIYSAVAEGSEKLEIFADTAGMTAKQFSEAWRNDPIAATDAFIKGLGDIKDAGGNVIAVLDSLGLKGTQDRQVLLGLTGAGDLLTKSLDDQARAWEENTALATEAEKRYATTEAQLEVLRNQIVDAAIDLGSALLPAIRAVTDVLGTMIEGFAALPGPVKDAVVLVGGLTTGLVGFVGVAATLAPKIAALKTALEGMGTGGQFMARNLGNIGLALGGVTAALAVGAFAFGTYKQRQDDARRAAKELADEATSTGEAIEDVARRKMAVAFAESEQVTRGLELLGMSFEDLRGPLEASNGEFERWRRNLIESNGGSGAAASAAQQLADRVGAYREQISTANDITEKTDRALEELGVAGEAGAQGIDKATEAAEISEKAMQELADAVDAIFNSLYGVEAAADQFQQGLNDLDDVMKQAIEDGLNLNDVLGDQSDGALTLRGHMRDLASDAAAVIQEWVEQGVTGQELTDRINGLSASLREQALAAGVPEAAVDHYLELLLAIPSEVPTTITANTGPAVDAVNAFISGVQGAVATVTVRAKNAFSIWGNAEGGLAGTGRRLSGPTGTDRIPTLLSPGEFTVRASAVRKLGLGTMQAINSGTLPGRYEGGPRVSTAAPQQAPIYATVEVPIDLEGQALIRVVAKEVRLAGGVDKAFGK